MEGRTVPDLERWVIRRLRVHESWFLDAPLAFHARQIQYPQVAAICDSQLLPGGRWLIAITLEGQVFAYDLNSSCAEHQLLFDSGEYDKEDRTLDNLTSFAVWVGPLGRTLSFRVVLWRVTGPTAGEFSIYGVELRFNHIFSGARD